MRTAIKSSPYAAKKVPSPASSRMAPPSGSTSEAAPPVRNCGARRYRNTSSKGSSERKRQTESKHEFSFATRRNISQGPSGAARLLLIACFINHFAAQHGNSAPAFNSVCHAYLHVILGASAHQGIRAVDARMWGDRPARLCKRYVTPCSRPTPWRGSSSTS